MENYVVDPKVRTGKKSLAHLVMLQRKCFRKKRGHIHSIEAHLKGLLMAKTGT